MKLINKISIALVFCFPAVSLAGSQPPVSCPKLLEAINQIPESYAEHPVQAFFAQLKWILDRQMLGPFEYENIETLSTWRNARKLPNIPTPPPREVRLFHVLRYAHKRGHDFAVAQFFQTLQSLNFSIATSAADEFGGIPQISRKLGPHAISRLDQQFRDLHRFWGELNVRERQLVTQWLGLMFREGYLCASPRVWRVDALNERQCALLKNPPPPLAPRESRIHVRQLGQRLLALYEIEAPGHDLVHGQSLEAAIQRLLFSVRR